VNPQEKQADDGPLADQLSISVLLRIAGRKLPEKELLLLQA
jgi:hypothetical protein